MKVDMDSTVLGKIPQEATALDRAQLLTERAATVGFDWSDSASVLSKVDEELQEVRDALLTGDPVQIQDEIGDLLFAVVNLARKQEIAAEIALDGTNAKFRLRFSYIESQLLRQGRSLQEADLDEMDALWRVAKSLEG